MTDLFDHAQPTTDEGGAYLSASALIAVDDLIEMDLTVPKWGKLRIRALSLAQEDKIELESLTQHPKTKEWYQPPALKAALTLREGILVPKLDNAQALTMTNRNPHVALGVVRWIRLLSSLDHKAIEKYVADITHLDGAPAPVDEGGGGGPAVGAGDSGTGQGE